MPELTRRPDPHHAGSWYVYYGDVHVGTIAKVVDTSRVASWQWSVGFYPGTRPGEHRDGSASTFDEARAAFEAAWLPFLARRTEADFQKWRDREAWNEEKRRRFARGERMPPDWRPHV